MGFILFAKVFIEIGSNSCPGCHSGFRDTTTVSSVSTYELCESALYEIELGHASLAARAFIASARSVRPGCCSKNVFRARSNPGLAWSTTTSKVCGRTSRSDFIEATGSGKSAYPHSSTTNRPWSGSSKVRRATCAPGAKGKKATSICMVSFPRTLAAILSAPNAPGYLLRITRGNCDSTLSQERLLTTLPSARRVMSAMSAPRVTPILPSFLETFLLLDVFSLALPCSSKSSPSRAFGSSKRKF
mmetsp:Transcript_12412/g.41269  ORF Transcript_12412/g.41269 Transcript_12412/m.41269 type:complete len:245 (+) Transcript_12412:2806-3540(+)